MACRRQSPGSLHARPSECIWVRISSCKDTGHTGLRPTLLTLFSLNYIFKGSISKYSLILRCWQLGPTYEFGGWDTIQLLTLIPETKRSATHTRGIPYICWLLSAAVLFKVWSRIPCNPVSWDLNKNKPAQAPESESGGGDGRAQV